MMGSFVIPDASDACSTWFYELPSHRLTKIDQRGLGRLFVCREGRSSRSKLEGHYTSQMRFNNIQKYSRLYSALMICYHFFNDAQAQIWDCSHSYGQYPHPVFFFSIVFLDDDSTFAISVLPTESLNGS